MEIHIHKTPGLRNDLLVVIPRSEIEDVLFHIANRDRLRALPGLLRHVEQDAEERKQVGECKAPVEEHLARLSAKGHGLLDADGRPARRLIAIGSRNVGNNHGYVAWQREENPKLFHVRGEPLNYRFYSCLVKYGDGRLAVSALRFNEQQQQVFTGEADISADVTWCVYANQVLRSGHPVDIEEIIDQFYDIHHVLAYDRDKRSGRQIESEIFAGYPEKFRENALRAWREKGVPRNRFLHSCLGLSEESIYILQREGTIEEMAHWLKEAGAQDGLILENGGSPACWAWWPYPRGGFLFTAPDYRPKASAIIAFVLKGPAHSDLPGGSVSFSVV